jgi:AcrR family transcriptional regulator
MATSTREKLIQTAHDLFYFEGFHMVGLDRIFEGVGVTKSTFYNHFESKDDLILAVLRWHDRWWQDTFRQMLRSHGGDTPRGQLLAIGDVLDDMFQGACGGEFNGCLFVNVAVEFPLPRDPAHRLAAEHKEAMEDILREIAGYAGAPEPKAMAQELALLMEGAYVTRQVSGSEAPAEVARRLIRMVVERHLGE